MNTSEILRAARAKIADAAHWTKGWFAHTEDGRICASASPFACKWCPVGALCAVTPSPGPALRFLNEALPGDYYSIPTWNDLDATTHIDVLAAYDRAIASAEAQEATA